MKTTANQKIETLLTRLEEEGIIRRTRDHYHPDTLAYVSHRDVFPVAGIPEDIKTVELHLPNRRRISPYGYIYEFDFYGLNVKVINYLYLEHYRLHVLSDLLMSIILKALPECTKELIIEKLKEFKEVPFFEHMFYIELLYWVSRRVDGLSSISRYFERLQVDLIENFTEMGPLIDKTSSLGEQFYEALKYMMEPIEYFFEHEFTPCNALEGHYKVIMQSKDGTLNETFPKNNFLSAIGLILDYVNVIGLEKLEEQHIECWDKPYLVFDKLTFKFVQ